MMASGGWAVIKLHHDETTILSASANTANHGGDLEFLVLDAGGKFLTGVGQGTSERGQTLLVQDREAGLDVRTHVPENGSSPLRVEITISGDPFDGYAIAWAAGEMTSFAWAVGTSGEGRGELLATGSRWSYSEGNDADSDRHVVLRNHGAQAVAQSGARIPFHVTGKFLGFVGLSHPPEQDIRLETPTGVEVCSCYYLSLAGPGSAGPGDYVVRRDAMSVEPVFPTKLLAGIDIPWPLR